MNLLHSLEDQSNLLKIKIISVYGLNDEIYYLVGEIYGFYERQLLLKYSYLESVYILLKWLKLIYHKENDYY